MKRSLGSIAIGAVFSLTVVGCGGTEVQEGQPAQVRAALATLPDFTVRTVTGPASLQPGQQVTAQVEVCNLGLDGSTDVEVYLSADQVITPNGPEPSPDSYVGWAQVPWLMEGQCTTVTVSGWAYAPPPGNDGPYYLGAVADPWNMQLELLEDNNSNSIRVGVGYRTDFTVKSVSAPGSVQPGQPLIAQVEVCNQGTADGPADVEVYLSADAVITPNGPQPSPDSFVGGAWGLWLMHGQCTTVAVSGPAYPPPPGGDGPYYLGAVADPQNSQTELIEDNNTNSTRIGVGNRPDFTVKSVSAPASAQPGQQVTAQVEVCNQGTTDGSADVEVYLSADAVITPNGPQPSPDSFVGGAWGLWLMHGQCTTVAVSGPVYPPPPGGDGPYYLGAVADPQDMQVELFEDNNTLSARMGVGYAPDFTVKSVTAPPSAQPGQPVTAQVEVCNQGTADGWTDVEVYLSADAVITPNGPQPSPDSFVGSAWGLWLMHGQCTTVAVSGPAYPPPPGGDGPYFLGAVADPQNMQMELLEDNNTHSTRMGVGNRPDFTVKSVSAPVSAQPWQQVTAQVQVCNQGTMDGWTDVEVYLSADQVITPNGPQPSPDSFMGSAPTPWLMHGQCTTVAVNGPVYPPPPGGDGPYFLGAVVDPQNMQVELFEDNNTNSTRIGVGNRADFTVKSVSAPASVQPGLTLIAQVEVCNQGTMDGSTDVEVYLSADQVITPNGPQPSPDSFMGSAPTPWLMHGQCTTVAVNGPVYPPPPGGDGPYYLGAVADPQNSQTELMEDNNTNSTRMGVGNRADFTVKSVSAPASVQPGQPLIAQVEVCNQGTMDGPADVEVYLSADAVITPNGPQPSPDSFVGNAWGLWLMHGQCTTVAVSGPAYPPPPGGDGPYFLGAVADPQNMQMELLEDNNTHSTRIGVGNRADFTVKSVSAPASVQPGQQVTAQVQVCNQGTMDGSTDVEVYLSADQVITPNGPQPSPDSFVGSAWGLWLMHGQCTTVAVSGPAYPPPPGGDGPYFLGAVADPQNMQMELLEDNNTHSTRMGVGNRPDFTVKSVSAPVSAQPWQQVTAQVQVCNQGTMDGWTDVEVYLSADQVITPNGPQPSPDSFMGGAPTPWLMHGQCTTVAVNGPVYPPPPGGDGPYFLGAVADTQNMQVELFEDNNTDSTRIGVGNRADFTVKSVSAPASVQPGQPLIAQVEVCNQGTMDGPADVEVYLLCRRRHHPEWPAAIAGLVRGQCVGAVADARAVHDGRGERSGVPASAGRRRAVLPGRGRGPPELADGAHGGQQHPLDPDGSGEPRGLHGEVRFGAGQRAAGTAGDGAGGGVQPGDHGRLDGRGGVPVGGRRHHHPEWPAAVAGLLRG